MTLIGYPAAVTLDASINVLRAQSVCRWPAPITFRALDVSFAFASAVNARSAARTCFIASAWFGSWVSVRAIVRGTSGSLSFVSRLAHVAVIASGVISAILSQQKSISTFKCNKVESFITFISDCLFRFLRRDFRKKSDRKDSQLLLG